MLTEIFGEYPQVKVIDLLITHPRIQYTKTADCAEIGRATLYKFWDVLERYQIGKTILYIQNREELKEVEAEKVPAHG